MATITITIDQVIELSNKANSAKESLRQAKLALGRSERAVISRTKELEEAEKAVETAKIALAKKA